MKQDGYLPTLPPSKIAKSCARTRVDCSDIFRICFNFILMPLTWPFITTNIGKYDFFEKGVTMSVEAYCMKCKEKKEMQNPAESTTKNGKPITKGSCPVCGSTICRIGAAKK